MQPEPDNPGQDVLLVYSTCPDRATAEAIAAALVEEGLAACVNVIPRVVSIYAWRGKLCNDEECLMLIKSTRPGLNALTRRINALHPYELPEVLAVPSSGGSSAYLDWVAGSVGSPISETP